MHVGVLREGNTMIIKEKRRYDKITGRPSLSNARKKCDYEDQNLAAVIGNYPLRNQCIFLLG